jgi:hypothetical protein
MGAAAKVTEGVMEAEVMEAGATAAEVLAVPGAVASEVA